MHFNRQKKSLVVHRETRVARNGWSASLRHVVLAGAVWVLTAVGPAVAETLDGVWTPTAGMLAGEALPPAVLKTMQLTIRGTSYSTLVGEVKDVGELKIDARALPPAMDIVGGEGPNKGKLFPAIFELKGDTLRVCYDLSGKRRPGAFATDRGTQLLLLTYERKK